MAQSNEPEQNALSTTSSKSSDRRTAATAATHATTTATTKASSKTTTKSASTTTSKATSTAKSSQTASKAAVKSADNYANQSAENDAHKSASKQATEPANKTISKPARTTSKSSANRKADASRQAKPASLIFSSPAPTLEIREPGQVGRVAILKVTPSNAEGVYAPRVELGETIDVSAQVFIEGRSRIGVTAVLLNPRGKEYQRVAMRCTNPGLDRWQAAMIAGEPSDAKPWQQEFATVKRQLGEWKLVIEGWADPYASWLHDAQITVPLGDGVENTLQAGADLFERWSKSKDAHLKADEKKHLANIALSLRNSAVEPNTRLAMASDETVSLLHELKPLREAISASSGQTITVERPGASFAAWYQFFPRSEGAYVDPTTKRIVSGTLQTSVAGLDRAASLGFDIVYLPPIFPIGTTNRKGRNNALVAERDDPGSPFGIGSAFGGHDTVHEELGTYEEFKTLCKQAHERNLEIALDFALQCSPDHPWVSEHPNWFQHKPDGSIAFAENPPKKYQDIYPIDFNADFDGIKAEVVRLLEWWIKAGVTIFRVDNPHTKPVRFWQEVIAAITKKHPEILFLAEAFTRPGMMRALSYVGFTQSHCYFPWRNTREELEEYLGETNGDGAYFQHNSFWPTTPDILTAYLRDNGVAGHAVRAVLAAFGSPSWGIYNGYELIENAQRPGVEEQLDNEKYELKVRDWSKADQIGISQLLTALNTIRRGHISTRSYHNLHVLPTSNPAIVAFARHTPADLTQSGKADTVIVVVNLDCANAQQATVSVDLSALGLPLDHGYQVHDELTGRVFTWSSENFVSLAPWADVAHILTPID